MDHNRSVQGALALLREDLDAALGRVDPAVHARLMLRYVLDRDAPALGLFPVNATRCPNCDQPCGNSRSPYCSDTCKETAAFVRQFRSALSDGMISDPERQLALGQKLWHLAGGGYPYRLTLAPPNALKQVDKRTGGSCELCGNPAATYDHLGSG